MAILPRLPLERKTHAKSSTTQAMTRLMNLHCYPGCQPSASLLLRGITLTGPPRLVKWVLTSLVKHWYFWGCPSGAHSSTFFPILTIPTSLLVMNCAEGPYHTDSVYNGYSLLCIYCLELELQRACASVSFSPTASKSWLSISCPVKMIPRIILPFGSRGYKYILSMEPSQHRNSFCSQNIHWLETPQT